MSEKIKLSIITKGDWESGFRLAGVDVHRAQDIQEVRSILQPLLEKSEPSLVAIEEDLFPSQDKKLQKRLEEKPFPVLISLPKAELRAAEDPEKYVSELVRACIGYYVKLK
ncbi:MAG: V-type ATP synthase subunit F [Chlamydiae bacterium]|nr:V-type ATP synthase subunit F [Chlamydiota bacterium]MBI3266831.1 V-type ATP synthase subunit F [Chlamydiota bacterium]